MPSEKAVMILKSKTNLTEEEINKLSDSEAWKIIYSFRSNKEKDNRLQICFTGFNEDRKKELIGVAENSKLKVTSSVTKSLDFLCIGNNAGPKKMETAINQGVQILKEDEFILFAKTGEVPN